MLFCYFIVFLRYLTDNQRVFSSYVSGKEFSGGSAAQCEVLCVVGWFISTLNMAVKY